MTDTATRSTPRRPRPRFRPVEVVDVRRLSPHFVAISFTGHLDGFRLEAPTQHIKVLIPGRGEHGVVVPQAGPDGPLWPVDQPRPIMRTYTPRRFDPTTGVLEVDFVIHGEGPASAWADRAVPGDGLAIAGPGGRMPLETTSGPWVMAGDESAIPAVGTLLDALPGDTAANVFIETDEWTEGVELGGKGGARITWLPRAGTDAPGSLLHQALTTAPISADTNVWAACEATAVRHIRRTLLDDRRVEPGRLVTRGYWRIGEANHPDHDHGDDG